MNPEQRIHDNERLDLLPEHVPFSRSHCHGSPVSQPNCVVRRPWLFTRRPQLHGTFSTPTPRDSRSVWLTLRDQLRREWRDACFAGGVTDESGGWNALFGGVATR